MTEFDLINDIKEKFGLALIGDDCAVLPRDAESDLLVTSDLLAEEIDFRFEWASPEMLGRKALAVSLSDIASMGGRPEYGLLSLAVPESLWERQFLDAFYEGWHSVARKYGVVLAGGDVSKTTAKLLIDSTVLGTVPKGKAIRRSGARAGDLIFVTGALGGATAGFRLLEQGHRYEAGSSDPLSELMLRQLSPTPRTDFAGVLLQTGLVTAMIDISDGLSSDLAHICEAGGVGAVVEASEVPFDSALLKVVGDTEAALAMALHGGEDFELLFTAPAEIASKVEGIFRIGKITSGNSVEILTSGQTEKLPPAGYRHF